MVCVQSLGTLWNNIHHQNFYKMKRLKKNRLPLIAGLLIVVAAMLAGKMLDGTPIKQQWPFKNSKVTPPAKSMTIQLLRTPSSSGNVLLTADYEPELVEGAREFSIFIDEANSAVKKQVVLRDDGSNGDAVAGDHKFTAVLQENLKAFKGKMLLAERELKASGGKLVVFEGRSGQIKQKDMLFDLAAFERFEPVTIDSDIFGTPLNKLNPTPGAATGRTDVDANATLLTDHVLLDKGGLAEEEVFDPGGGGVITPPPPCSPIIDRAKSLFVTDISVTEDPVRTFNPCTRVGNPNGAWTFKTVMTNMANQPLTGVTPDAFVQEWLDTWMRGAPRLTPGTLNPVVNTQVLDSRVHPITPLTTQATTILHAVIKPWLRAAAGNPTLVIDSLPTSPRYWKTIWQGLTSSYVDVLQFAPFKLTALVNRVDLISSSTTTTGGGYAGGTVTTTSITNGGEGRLIYSIVKDPRGACTEPVSSLTQPFEGFNVILEYGIPITDCATLLDYQRKWRALSDIPFGSSFNAALETVTNVFTGMNAAPSKPNGSALNQLRTNEIAITSLLGGTLPTPYSPGSSGNAPFWQLREQVLRPGSPFLVNTTTKLEPMAKFNGASFTPLTSGNSLADIAILANFVNTNAAVIKTFNFSVPDVLGGVNFQAGRADIHSPAATTTPHHWNGRNTLGSTFIADDSARFVFSLNTCSGCHGGETGTPFVHVRYIGFGHNITPTSTSPPFGLRDLSSFLTGLGPDAIATDDDNDPNGFFFVSDAAGRPTGAPRIRGFNDLLRRHKFMADFLCAGCASSGTLVSTVGVLTGAGPTGVFFESAAITH